MQESSIYHMVEKMTYTSYDPGVPTYAQIPGVEPCPTYSPAIFYNYGRGGIARGEAAGAEGF